jgi:cell division protein ZapE
MDLFFDALNVAKKRRAHFHAFMADAHERLHRARQTAANGVADPVTRVADEIARETRVLCFDEFSVTDIADATILARLFSALFAAGVTVVATSNVEAARLYEGGRNRELFLPFIALLQERMEILHLVARADYRLERESFGDVYFSPADSRARAAIDALFLGLTGCARGKPASIECKRRRIEVPQAAGRVARFTFGEICGRPLGPADYMALAQGFDAVIVEDVPAMAPEQRNEARRFITLVDVLYEAKALLVISSETEAQDLYRAEHGNEAREFQRAVSRLIEMRSHEYLENCAAWREEGASAAG